MPPTSEEVLKAFEDCIKGKSGTKAAIEFKENLDSNLQLLLEDLTSKQYEISPTRCFVVKKPKPREIWAGAFRDRVVHHVMYNRISPAFYLSFSAASCACIPGRGTLYGVNRLERQVRQVTQNWAKPAHYLKLDLSNFFVSIHKPTLYTLLQPKLQDEWTTWITSTILFHDPRGSAEVRSPDRIMALVPEHKSLFHAQPNCGLPIGNHSSQFFANVYLNLLDQFIVHQLKPRGYIRYVDDFILLHESPQWLNEAQIKIETFLADRLQAEINPTKTVLQRVDRGVDFVGQVIKPWHRVPRGNLMPKALASIWEAECPAARRSSANSYLGLLRQTSAYSERSKLAKRMTLHGHHVDRDLTRAFAHNDEEALCAT